MIWQGTTTATALGDTLSIQEANFAGNWFGNRPLPSAMFAEIENADRFN